MLPVMCNDEAIDAVAPFWHLMPDYYRAAESASKHGSIGYIEVDFWGGTGEQIAIIWQGGNSVFGPILSKHNYQNNEEGAVNQLAKLMGVEMRNFHDEFAALGLDKFRLVEDWLSNPFER